MDALWEQDEENQNEMRACVGDTLEMTEDKVLAEIEGCIDKFNKERDQIWL